MFDLVCTDHCYGKNSAWLACLYMLRSYYLWLSDKKDAAFNALDAASDHAGYYDHLHKNGPQFFSSPLLCHVKTNAGSLPDECAFRKELPEVWPWWDVPKRDAVRTEMQADPRWAAWIQRASTAKTI